MSLATEATYYRTALLLGLVRGETVHVWADDAIAREAAPHPALIAVASTPPDDLSGLRDALWPLVIEPDPLDVLRAVLGLVCADVTSGRRSLHDTLTVLRQVRSMVKLPRPLYDDLSTALVEHTNRDSDGTDIRGWLIQFAGAQEPYTSSTSTRSRIPRTSR